MDFEDSSAIFQTFLPITSGQLVEHPFRAIVDVVPCWYLLLLAKLFNDECLAFFCSERDYLVTASIFHVGHFVKQYAFFDQLRGFSRIFRDFAPYNGFGFASTGPTAVRFSHRPFLLTKESTRCDAFSKMEGDKMTLFRNVKRLIQISLFPLFGQDESNFVPKTKQVLI